MMGTRRTRVFCIRQRIKALQTGEFSSEHQTERLFCILLSLPHHSPSEAICRQDWRFEQENWSPDHWDVRAWVTSSLPASNESGLTKEDEIRRFVIEREIPNAGKIVGADLCAAAIKSNEALAALAPHVQWVQTYIADDRLFCIYLADEEDDVRRHADITGFPANRIIEVRHIIDPMTANPPHGDRDVGDI